MNFRTVLFAVFVVVLGMACGSEAPDNSASTTEQTNAAAPATTDASGVALNPEHGQPGHRCDIAVGAPLNSAPATTEQSPLIQTQPAATQEAPAVTVPAATTEVKPGTNPPHGQPGHRCDIAVGAPLN